MGLISPGCLLEIGVPYPLAILKPEIHRWNLRWLSGPWKQGGLEAEYALEGCKAGGVLTEWVLCVLGPGKESAPAMLVPVAVTVQVPPSILNPLLSLVIGLRVVTGG